MTIFVHPWSHQCFNTEKIVSNVTSVTSNLLANDINVKEDSCPFECLQFDHKNGSKGCEEIFSVNYDVKDTVLKVLLVVMLFGGVLAMLSNSVVLFFGIVKRDLKLFPPEILSLAVTDFLTGLLGTPSVMAIYYYSELIFSDFKFLLKCVCSHMHVVNKLKETVSKIRHDKMF